MRPLRHIANAYLIVFASFFYNPNYVWANANVCAEALSPVSQTTSAYVGLVMGLFKKGALHFDDLKLIIDKRADPMHLVDRRLPQSEAFAYSKGFMKLRPSDLEWGEIQAKLREVTATFAVTQKDRTAATVDTAPFIGTVPVKEFIDSDLAAGATYVGHVFDSQFDNRGNGFVFFFDTTGGAARRRRLRFLNALTGKYLTLDETPEPRKVWHVGTAVTTPDGTSYGIASTIDGIRIYNLNTGKLFHRISLGVIPGLKRRAIGRKIFGGSDPQLESIRASLLVKKDGSLGVFIEGAIDAPLYYDVESGNILAAPSPYRGHSFKMSADRTKVIVTKFDGDIFEFSQFDEFGFQKLLSIPLDSSFVLKKSAYRKHYQLYTSETGRQILAIWFQDGLFIYDVEAKSMLRKIAVPYGRELQIFIEPQPGEVFVAGAAPPEQLPGEVIFYHLRDEAKDYAVPFDSTIPGPRALVVEGADKKQHVLLTPFYESATVEMWDPLKGTLIKLAIPNGLAIIPGLAVTGETDKWSPALFRARDGFRLIQLYGPAKSGD